MREALKNVICPSCGGLPAGKDIYFNEQNLRMENSRLKEEVCRLKLLQKNLNCFYFLLVKIRLLLCR